ncbi:beta-galactosidase, partial [Streptomyces sp. NPDC003327]
HGGTNFGFTNGANDKHTYRPTITSYDYDAPLDEAGDPTDKYTAFRNTIATYAPVPDEPAPAPAPKLSLPPLRLTHSASLLDHADLLGTPVTAQRPLTMEELGQDFGFVLYETTLPLHGPCHLDIEHVRDRAQAFVDGQPVGTLEREHHEHALAFTSPRSGATLTLLVENQGRVNYGPGIHDRKGLLGTIRINGTPPTTWTSRPLPLTDPDVLPYTPTVTPPTGPTFHTATLHVATPADTHLHLDGWTKGNAWINGFNLGRYWSRGPQRSLYVPAPVLRPGANTLTLLELHAGPHTPTVTLHGTPDLGPTEE